MENHKFYYLKSRKSTKYDITTSKATEIPNPEKGTKCIKILLY